MISPQASKLSKCLTFFIIINDDGNNELGRGIIIIGLQSRKSRAIIDHCLISRAVVFMYVLYVSYPMYYVDQGWMEMICVLLLNAGCSYESTQFSSTYIGMYIIVNKYRHTRHHR